MSGLIPDESAILDFRHLLKQVSLEDPVEKGRASERAKVEHPFQTVKGLFHYGRVRYRSLAKNHESTGGAAGHNQPDVVIGVAFSLNQGSMGLAPYGSPI